MKLHEIIEVHEKPYFRKMRVESGFMYNFYDTDKDDYQQEWTFVPYPSEQVKKSLGEESRKVAAKLILSRIDEGNEGNEADTRR